MKKILQISLIIFIGLFSCNSKKEIDLKLPPYKPQYVVECYMMPGQTFKLLLSQSTGIENTIPLDPLVFADVKIFHNSDTIQLEPIPYLDTTYYKFYTYTSNRQVEYDTVHPYYLEIKIQNSDVVLRSQTKFLAKPVIKEIAMNTLNGDDYSLNVTVDDIDKGKTNYYLFQILDSAAGREFNYRPRNRAYFDDKLVASDRIGIYTSYRYGLGESIIARAFHLTKDHYDFISSIDEAQNANGNPFGRPTFIVSNVSGGVGIFTTINFSERFAVIGQ